MRKLLVSQKVNIDSHGILTDVLESSLVQYFTALGITLYPVSNFSGSLDNFLGGVMFEGLILSGGGDVNPECIDADQEMVFRHFPEREEVERCLIRKMIEKKMPVLGICHGMQLLNCYFGGRLTADIHSHEDEYRKPGSNHPIHIEKEILGLSGTFEINHYHNHGVRRSQVAPLFNIFAVDTDYDVVEGIVHKELQILGIHWHPERNSPDNELNRRIIKGFFKI
jgi:putative glutamine amidotransferase